MEIEEGREEGIEEATTNILKNDGSFVLRSMTCICHMSNPNFHFYDKTLIDILL